MELIIRALIVMELAVTDMCVFNGAVVTQFGSPQG